MQKHHLLRLLITFLCFFTFFSLQAQEKKLSDRKEVQAFIKTLVEKHHFDANQLTSWIDKAKIQPKILEAIAKPAEKLPWHRYQAIFLSPKRIEEGVSFWQQNKAALAAAEKEYGVPAEIITAILGVETFYGKQSGQYLVLDALVTLGFEYPPRAPFFLSELEAFLLLAREEKWDPTQIKGSYAGAMGKPQFIASSYRQYAVDFNHNGQRDLINNVDDAIGSIANYFKVHAWKKEGPIAFRANVTGDKFKQVIASKANPKPSYRLDKISELGIQLKDNAKIPNAHEAELYSLIALEGKEGPEYWLAANNFYVITRYNRSSLYAMAVYDLSEQIKAAYQSQT